MTCVNGEQHRAVVVGVAHLTAGGWGAEVVVQAAAAQAVDDVGDAVAADAFVIVFMAIENQVSAPSGIRPITGRA